MAGDSLTQMTLTGHVTREQQDLTIRAQMVIIPVGQVRGMSFINFRYLDAVFFFFCTISNIFKWPFSRLMRLGSMSNLHRLLVLV